MADMRRIIQLGRRRAHRPATWLLAALGFAPAPLRSQANPPELAREVMAAESSFAASMAQRDIAAFARHVAADAVFFGTSGSLRGKAAVVDGWRPLFEGSAAPFSWRPESVDVLPSGTLAWSTGPVHDAAGRQIGTFNSVWRREMDGTWLVIFDKGCPVCACAGAAERR
jgi:ketosteroid isomerase-like protein